MTINRSAFINKFLEELNENIQVIIKVAIVLKKDPNKEDELVVLLRALHTVKGSSRMLKFTKVEQIAHGLENIFKAFKDRRIQALDAGLVKLIFLGTDYCKAGYELIKRDKDDALLEIEALLAIFKKAESLEPYDLKEVPPPPVLVAEDKIDKKRSADDLPDSELDQMNLSLPEYETIRIKISDIDQSIRALNNLIIKQFQLKKEYEYINILENSIKEFFIQFQDGKENKYDEKNKEKSEHILKDVQKIKKNFLERLTLIEANTFEIQEGIIALRMLPLELILGSLDKMVEETAISMGKEIDLIIQGREVKLDKVILEKINDPIIHLVRNAIDHGIETPQERTKRGKPPIGRIGIKCYSEGQNIVVEIGDDGNGIDYDVVRRKAIEKGLGEEDSIKKMTEEELNNFLFMAGFSTKQEVSDLSGRGIGMNIVKHNIEKIKGKISIQSERDKGSTIILSLPLSLATVEGFFVTAGGKKFLIPSNFVREIIILKKEEKITLLNSEVLRLRDKIIPLYKLSRVLSIETESSLEEMSFVVVVETAGEMIGMIVDSVIEHSSLIFKPLPKNLHKLVFIQGIVFDESFNVINILYLPGLIQKFKSFSNLDTRKRFVKENKKYKNILLVDDSVNTREIVKSILEVDDYNITTAVDGVDGLAKARDKTYHMVITDLNMPRMDGITLVENLRREEKYKSTPILVISTLDNDDLSKKLKAVNIQGTINKGDFDRNNLVGIVRNLIG
jgi:chemotaxis protein histidine kinase CheA/CheY-like chemotaxis protein